MTELDEKIIEAIRFEKVITQASEDIKELFCDEDTYNDFKASDTNIILIAPRGYGKTAYFKLFDIECRQTLNEMRKLAIFIKVDYIYLSLKANYKKVQTNVLQSYLIIKIIENFLEKLGVDDKKELKRIDLSLITKREFKNTKDILNELREIKNQILKFKIDVQEISKDKKQLGVSIEAPTQIPLPKLNLSYSNEKKERIENFVIDKFQTSFFHLRDFMNQLLNLLDINLFILFDEFSEVDPINQKELFQFIKNLTEGTRVKAKIAVIPPKYYYYTGEGDDPIFDPINRDAREIYLISRFYNKVNIHKEILKKRFHFKRLQIVLDEIFEEIGLCDLCWNISMSNPRDFLNLIDKAYNNSRLKKGAVHKKISASNVRNAVFNLADTSFVNIQFRNKNAISFMSIILTELRKKNSRDRLDKAFLRFISEKSIIKDPNYLRDFILQKIIYSTKEREGKRHNIKEGWEYILNFIYAIKNGVFGEYQKISANSIKSLDFKPEYRIYIPITSDASSEVEDIKNCPNCNKYIEISFKFCPHCAHPFQLIEPQPEKTPIEDDDTVIMNLEDYEEQIRYWGPKLTDTLYKHGINTLIEFVNNGLDYYIEEGFLRNFKNLRNIFSRAKEIVEQNI